MGQNARLVLGGERAEGFIFDGAGGMLGVLGLEHGEADVIGGDAEAGDGLEERVEGLGEAFGE